MNTEALNARTPGPPGQMPPDQAIQTIHPGLYHPWGRRVVYALILCLALGLRVHLAGIAYPSGMDVPHIIHQGVYWAQGVPGALSTIWPEIPVLISGMAYRQGWDPAEALQWSTVIWGTLMVGMTMLLTRRYFASDLAAWLAGGWVTANQSLLDHSVNSMPEMGSCLCLIGACALLAREIRGMNPRIPSLLGGYGMLALALYFRPLEAMVATAVITAWLLVVHLRAGWKAWARLAAGLLFYLLLMTPHAMLQEGDKTSYQSITPRMSNLVLGQRAYDSKFLYDPDSSWRKDIEELEQAGIGRWLWRHRSEISRRYLSNMMSAVRAYGNYLFPNSFRLGNAWFIAMAAFIFLRGFFGPWRKQHVFLALMSLALPLGVSVSYVYTRWLIQYLPLVVAMAAAHLALSPVLTGRAWKKAFWLLILLAMMGDSAALAWQAHGDMAWRWDNERTIAAWLRETAADGDRIMAGRPSLSIGFDLARPQRLVQLPYGSPERIEQIAGKANVSYIVLSDWYNPHWPVNRLFDGAPAPANWTLVKNQKFAYSHPVWGDLEDSYRIYKRQSAVPDSAPP